VRPLVEGLIEPRECGVVLTETGMDERNTVRSYKLLARQPFQFGQDLLSLTGAASDSSDESSRRNRDRPFRNSFFDVLKFSERVVEFSKLLVGSAQPETRRWKVPVQCQHEFQLLDRLVAINQRRSSNADFAQCPLWVIGRHREASSPCPLYPQKRTSVGHISVRPLCANSRH
jgi:hypothetical protein